MARTRLALLSLVLALFGAGLASAEVWTVTLENGTIFETRYRPEPAPWDESITLLITDRGNQIGIASDDISDVISESEQHGFGYRLDTTTLFLGWSPNDLVTKDEEGNEQTYAAPAANSGGGYSVDQFLSIQVYDQSAAGGIPVSGSVVGETN